MKTTKVEEKMKEELNRVLMKLIWKKKKKSLKMELFNCLEFFKDSVNDRELLCEYLMYAL